MTVAIFKHWLALIFILFLILGAGTYTFCPWKILLESKIKTILQEQGFTNAQLTLSDIDFHTLTVRNIEWGDGPTLQALTQLTLDYSIWDLLTGHLKNLSVTNLKVNVKQVDNSWIFAGLTFAPTTSDTPLSVPVTKDQLAVIPLGHAALVNSHLNVTAPSWSVDLPVQMIWHKKPSPELTFQSKSFSFKTKQAEIQTGPINTKIELSSKDKSWKGAWGVKDIQITLSEMPIQILNGNGTLLITKDKLLTQGTFTSTVSKTLLKFKISYSFSNPSNATLTVSKAVMPWSGGAITVNDIKLPLLGDPQRLNLNLKLKDLSLNALLQQLTAKRASGSGQISGNLPITIEPDGSLLVHKGKLYAEGEGLIHMSPDVIPGDNAQISLVRDVLKNLNYTKLSINVQSDTDNGLSVLMKVNGNNPDVSNGRPVQLSVNLTGDVLDFVQQNMTLLTDPRKYLEQNKNAKP